MSRVLEVAALWFLLALVLALLIGRGIRLADRRAAIARSAEAATPVEADDASPYGATRPVPNLSADGTAAAADRELDAERVQPASRTPAPTTEATTTSRGSPPPPARTALRVHREGIS